MKILEYSVFQSDILKTVDFTYGKRYNIDY